MPSNMKKTGPSGSKGATMGKSAMGPVAKNVMDAHHKAVAKAHKDAAKPAKDGSGVKFKYPVRMG
jgi:hypothetical protein